jgi:hypothetical protein
MLYSLVLLLDNQSRVLTWPFDFLINIFINFRRHAKLLAAKPRPWNTANIYSHFPRARFCVLIRHEMTDNIIAPQRSSQTTLANKVFLSLWASNCINNGCYFLYSHDSTSWILWSCCPSQC